MKKIIALLVLACLLLLSPFASGKAKTMDTKTDNSLLNQLDLDNASIGECQTQEAGYSICVPVTDRSLFDELKKNFYGTVGSAVFKVEETSYSCIYYVYPDEENSALLLKPSSDNMQPIKLKFEEGWADLPVSLSELNISTNSTDWKLKASDGVSFGGLNHFQIPRAKVEATSLILNNKVYAQKPTGGLNYFSFTAPEAGKYCISGTWDDAVSSVPSGNVKCIFRGENNMSYLLRDNYISLEKNETIYLCIEAEHSQFYVSVLNGENIKYQIKKLNLMSYEKQTTEYYSLLGSNIELDQEASQVILCYTHEDGSAYGSYETVYFYPYTTKEASAEESTVLYTNQYKNGYTVSSGKCKINNIVIVDSFGRSQVYLGDVPIRWLETKSQTPTEPITEVAVNGTHYEISQGKSLKLLSSGNDTVKWSSSDTSVATVDQTGTVRVRNNTAGKNVIIMAASLDGSKIIKYKVTSVKGIVKKIKITGAKKVKAGKSLRLKAKVKATAKANKKVKWVSSNTKFATVTAKGLVKTKKAGKGKTVTITCKATDGSNKKAKVRIKIN